MALGTWAVVGGAVASSGSDAGSTLERIDAALAAGEIDEPQAALYRLFRVADRRRLPAELVAPAGRERPVRCATAIVRAARAARPAMTARQRASMDEVLPRRTPPPHPAEPSRYDSTYSTNFAVIVGDAGGVPQETIDFWLDTFEEVWEVEVTQNGFENPPCTDDHYFDVYIGNTGSDVPTIEPDVYGWTSTYGNGCPYVVVHEGYPSQPDPEGAAGVTAAHEFFHAIQAAYDWWEGDYWMEATAVWAEELVHDDVDDYLQYLNDGGWLEYPEAALRTEDGWHEYGNVIWALYLDERWGGPAAIEQIWRNCISVTSLNAMNGYLVSQGSSMDEAFMDFAARLSTGDFAEGASYEGVWTMDGHNSYPVTDASFSRYLPEGYGSNHIVFNPMGANPSTLYVHFDGEEQADGATVTWGVALISLSGGVPTIHELEVAADGTADGQIDDFGGGVGQVRMAVAVLGEDGAPPGSGGVGYRYSASLDGPPADDDDADDDDADDDGADDDGAPAPRDEGDGGGCRCRVAARAGGPVGWPVMAALALVLAGRLRRGRGRGGRRRAAEDSRIAGQMAPPSRT